MHTHQHPHTQLTRCTPAHITRSSAAAAAASQSSLTEFWFYIPLNTKHVISETFPHASLLAWYEEKLNPTQNKKLKPGLVAFYDIQPGNGAGLFSKEKISKGGDK